MDGTWKIILVALNAILLTSAVPQYGGGDASAPSPPPAGPPAPPAGPPAPPAGPPAGPPAAGGDLTVQCKATPDGSGKIKYDCSGANKDAITLKTDHTLWLESQSSSSQNLDIEIPNYNIDEFIKAAFKAAGPAGGAQINILLKKPEVTYNAEKDDAAAAGGSPPAVSVNYQPVEKISVHYPTQKQYSNGGGSGGGAAAAAASSGGAPAAPSGGPAGPSGSAPGAAGYARPYRQTGFQYNFVRV